MMTVIQLMPCISLVKIYRYIDSITFLVFAIIFQFIQYYCNFHISMQQINCLTSFQHVPKRQNHLLQYLKQTLLIIY